MMLMLTNFSNPVRGAAMTDISVFRRVTQLASVLMQSHLNEGDTAVDATAGTGEDTCMMAESVGKKGKVIAFDIQKQALELTEEKLKARGLREQVILLNAGHETMRNQEAVLTADNIRGIMFNLGYLPGGNETVCTQSATSLEAIRSGLDLLAKGGLMTICIYPHPAGYAEGMDIESYLSTVDSRFYVHKIKTLNRNNPPWLLAIEKIK